MFTQEKKFFLQKACPTNIEFARKVITDINTRNVIEELFRHDLLVQICGNKEQEYQKAVEEEGVFYFFNDYGKEVR